MECDIVVKIFSCKQFMESLTSEVNTKTKVVTWFQEFCTKLSNLLLDVTKYVKHIKPLDDAIKETMLLYLLQLNTTLSILIKIFMTEIEAFITITEARNCVARHLCVCLSGLEDVLTKTNIEVPASDGFVKFMDLALDKITEIDVEKGVQNALNICVEAKRIIEEALCHGMSIAQIALKDDCDSIKGSSKEVLLNLDELCQEISKPKLNIAMCNLFIDSCCDKLCALERKVNTAVLKLSLKVFSECSKPLEDLHRYCLSHSNNSEVLDELIADFDMHVDRMIQVGLFAVTCSTNVNYTLKMRSCLASLEALEGELVPALSAMHRDHSNHNLCYASILKHYWIKQASALKKYIYLIIDPFAFCQVTYEVIRDINNDLENRFRKTVLVDKSLVKPITLQAKILYEMLIVSIKDTPLENQETVQKYLNDVIHVTTEIDAAAEKLLHEKNICKENIFRVFKRCKVQENILRQLLVALKDDGQIEELNSSKEISNHSKDDVLDQIIDKGKQILKERSVLYRTPTKRRSYFNDSFKNMSKPVPLSRLVHMRNMQFSHSRCTNESSHFDIEITDILENFTSLSMLIEN